MRSGLVRISWRLFLYSGIVILGACSSLSDSAPTTAVITPTSIAQATATTPAPNPTTAEPTTAVPTAIPSPTETPTPTPTSHPPTETPTATRPTATPTEIAWQTFSNDQFELVHPGNWGFVGPDGIECAGIYHFFPTSLKLIRFSACWEEQIGGNQLTFTETYERFRTAFLTDSLITTQVINGMSVELIQYSNPDSNGIYSLTASEGTLALWQTGETGWALIDEGNEQQESGFFGRILASIKFHQSQ